jgi:hypothetical protein
MKVLMDKQIEKDTVSTSDEEQDILILDENGYDLEQFLCKCPGKDGGPEPN